MIIHPVEIESIYISNGHDFKGRFGREPLRHETPSVDEVECVAGRGIVGDRYYDYKDNWKGQITFIDRALIELVRESLEMDSLDVSAFRRNVVTRGLDLNTLIGKAFSIGDVRFAGIEECAPCVWMDQVIGQDACELMKGRGGLRCRILKSGRLKTGSVRVVVESP